MDEANILTSKVIVLGFKMALLKDQMPLNQD